MPETGRPATHLLGRDGGNSAAQTATVGKGQWQNTVKRLPLPSECRHRQRWIHWPERMGICVQCLRAHRAECLAAMVGPPSRTEDVGLLPMVASWAGQTAVLGAQACPPPSQCRRPYGWAGRPLLAQPWRWLPRPIEVSVHLLGSWNAAWTVQRAWLAKKRAAMTWLAEVAVGQRDLARLPLPPPCTPVLRRSCGRGCGVKVSQMRRRSRNQRGQGRLIGQAGVSMPAVSVAIKSSPRTTHDPLCHIATEALQLLDEGDCLRTIAEPPQRLCRSGPDPSPLA